MPSAARQAEQHLAKASSVTSLAPKPKGKAAKGAKGKAAAAKGRKGATSKKGDRVVWDSIPQKRRSGERGPIAGRQFASAARLHQVSFQDLGVSLKYKQKIKIKIMMIIIIIIIIFKTLSSLGVSLGRVERALFQRTLSAS